MRIYIDMLLHWAIYAPAAFLRTKSGLSTYGAPSTGSETPLPYAWLPWRFNNTLADRWLDAVDACMTRLQENCKSAQQQSQRDCLVRSYCQSWGFCVTCKARTHTPIRANETKRKWVKNCFFFSYVLAKLSLSYPVGIEVINSGQRNTPRLYIASQTFNWMKKKN